MKKIILIFTIILFYLLTKNSYPYDNEYVHKKININAAMQSNNFYNTMNKIGFEAVTPKRLLEEIRIYNRETQVWFEDGAQLEDETDCRSKFHFHDPTKSWDSAGLSNITIDTYCLNYTHRSSLVWAQDAGNMWTWQEARQYYFDALINPVRNIREQKLAYTFRSLGQVMHLISDSSVPAHTRNDIHVFPYTLPVVGIPVGNPTFESWAMSKYKVIAYTGIDIDQSIFNNAIAYPSAPVAISALWDMDKYNGYNPAFTIGPITGLAEYSNANFFSEDTIFSNYVYPAWSSVEEYEEIIDATSGKTRTYFRKVRDGESIEHLAAGKRFYKYLPSILKSSGLKLDEKCYKDYAAKLIPRAVGYSAGLLNYFFRGELEISPPDRYVYAVADGSVVPQVFTKIKAGVMNTTPDESIQAGILVAVAKFKVVPGYLPDLSSYPPNGNVMKATEYSYSVSAPVTLTEAQAASLNTQPVEFVFDFSGDNAIPAGITDLMLQVIFRGTLGNETDIAVAVGMKDLKEPTHQTFWNLTDMFSLDGHLYTAEDIRADSDLLSRTNGKYIDPHPITFEISYMPESPPAEPVYAAARVTDLPAGRYIRLIFLADNEPTYPFVRMAWHVELPDRAPEHGDNDYYFEPVINQEYGGIWYAPTEATVLRTVRRHFGAGVLRCEPLYEEPVTGNQYCAYPEEEAIIPADLVPFQTEILN